MFQVKSIVNSSILKNDKVYDVYSAEWAGSDTVFLIYGENKKWNWCLADYFVPLEDSYEYGYI